jgi:hypothetical protein
MIQLEKLIHQMKITYNLHKIFPNIQVCQFNITHKISQLQQYHYLMMNRVKYQSIKGCYKDYNKNRCYKKNKMLKN